MIYIKLNFMIFVLAKNLVHGADQLVNVLLTVTDGTTLDEVLELSADTPATVRVGELERPKEVVGLLEVRANSVDLVKKILNGDNTVLTETGLDLLVVDKRNTLLVNLTVTTLVKKLANSRLAGVTISDVRLNQTKKLLSGLGNSDENTVVNLQKSEKLKSLSGLRSNLVDTLNTDNEDQLGFRSNVDRTLSLSSTLLLNDSTLSIVVLLLISSSLLEDNLSLLLVSLK